VACFIIADGRRIDSFFADQYERYFQNIIQFIAAQGILKVLYINVYHHALKNVFAFNRQDEQVTNTQRLCSLNRHSKCFLNIDDKDGDSDVFKNRIECIRVGSVCVAKKIRISVS
jgi:hypothetical protein